VSLYLDASAVVPTVVDQAASPEMARYLKAAIEPLIVSDFAASEVASAISRLVRMNHLSGELAANRLGELDAWRATMTTGIDFQPSDFRLVDIFVRRLDLGLRAPDALHAAVCRRAFHTLVTLDRRLAVAAEGLGVRVDCLA
jgi:uncharacterized protein